MTQHTPDPQSTAGASLEQIQRWMQSVITHPGGVAGGAASDAARAHLDVAPENLHQVILPSDRLTSDQRLEIYVDAYYARLLECLDCEFAVTREALGAELFAGIAFGYLQQCPSQSYTLHQLGARFPGFLAETRLHERELPADAPGTWPEFIVELATFERAMGEVYDGPGIERGGALDPESLSQIDAADWENVRLVLAPCVRLCQFEHPVHEVWAAAKDGAMPEACAARSCRVMIHRRHYVVERHELSAGQFALIEALADGCSLAESIGRGLRETGLPTDDSARLLHAWFADWMRLGIFVEIAGTV